MPIYTKTGDTGTTALFGGKRVLKCEELVDVYGSIDELNSWIGLIASSVPTSSKLRRAGKRQALRKFLTVVQSDLFTIGSTLAGWPASTRGAKSTRGGKGNLDYLMDRVKEMEERIDEMDKELPQLVNFILPGGALLSSHIHIARAVSRRVERQAVALAQTHDIDSRILVYLNRLSDLFFMLARSINKDENVEEIIWQGIPRQEQK
ncbi:MAG: cob(I)yrinic acid a,c-diamide adenosyltransferase [bacterium]|nr:cob(I)yrinic acid a,c-diamide adenosyltransferase [bacterium]